MFRTTIKNYQAWISYWFTYHWQRITPIHRWVVGLGLIGVFIGCVLIGGLRILAPSPATSSHTASQTLIWVASQDLPENTPAQLLFFTFQPLEDLHHITCDHPVSFDSSDQLHTYQLRTPLKKGDVLCWGHLQKRPPTLMLRRGYRALGFVLKNPEILPALAPGMFVDAITMLPSQQRTFRLNHVRILEIFSENQPPVVLLEIPLERLEPLQLILQAHLPIYLLIKNTQEAGATVAAKIISPKISTDVP